MPRYHFHITNGEPILFDGAGTVLPDIEAALRRALQIVRGPLGGAVAVVGEPSNWRVEVVDEKSYLVLLVPFPFTAAAG